MRNATKVPNNVKNSPTKEKTFPSSPMDDIERGKLHWHTSFRNFAVDKQLVFKRFLHVWVVLFCFVLFEKQLHSDLEMTTLAQVGKKAVLVP